MGDDDTNKSGTEFEQGKGDKQASISAVKRKDYISDQLSKRSASPQLATIPADDYDLDHDPHAQEYLGGAEIPDIPLRRNITTRNDRDLGLDTLSALERILTGGNPHSPQPHVGGSQNNTSNSHPVRTDNGYDDQNVDLDQDFKGEGRLLYPVPECATEWEPNGRTGVSEGDEETPEPSLSHGSASPSANNYTTHLSPRVRAPTSYYDHSVDLHTAPRGGTAVSFQAGLQPKYIVPSLTATETSRTETSVHTEQAVTPTLPALQAKGVDDLEDGLHPVDEDNMDPGSFDLIVPSRPVGVYSLERRSELLFSTEHLRVIFADPIFLTRFTSFVAMYRPPASTALLNYALNAVKAIRAMDWTNAIITKSLRVEDKPQHAFFMGAVPELTVNESLRRKAASAMEVLARDELPAYVTHVWTDIVEVSMKRKITGSMPAHLRDMSEGLAEVFCISDPSRPDNPIVFASEEFHRTTQYGPDYVLGRNCRFLQGPKTNPYAVQRIREMLKQGKEHYETFLNYRRDGLPFMNLLMCTPLFDSKGQVRYQLGAQVDVSGLAKDCSGLESLRRLVDRDDEELSKLAAANQGYHQRSRRDSGTDFDDIPGGGSLNAPVGAAATSSHSRAPRIDETPKDEFRLLAEMFNRNELETVRRFGGRMHRSQQEQMQHAEALNNSANWHKGRVVLDDSSPPISPPISPPVNSATLPQQQQRRVISEDMGNPTTTDANGNISVSARPRSRAGATSPSPYPMRVDNSNSTSNGGVGTPRAPAIFENYLVVRPYPSMRILFASRPMRVPGMLQSHLMSRIGGSRRIHEELEQAFATGQSVTAKVKWISGSGLRNANAAIAAAQQQQQQPAANGHGHGARGGSGSGLIPDSSSASTASLNNLGRGGGDGGGGTANRSRQNSNGNDTSTRYDTVGMDGRPRWIHCTPLASTTGAVGVWVVVIVDEEGEASERAARRRQDFSTGAHPIYGNATSGDSLHSTSTTGGGSRQQQQRRQQRSAGWDEMSLTDFATMNRLPEDEDLRQHLRDMYEETRRRERGVGDNAGGWEKGWTKDPPVGRPGSRAGTRENGASGENTAAGRGSGSPAPRSVGGAHGFRNRFDGSGRSRSSTPDLMGPGANGA